MMVVSVLSVTHAEDRWRRHEDVSNVDVRDELLILSGPESSDGKTLEWVVSYPLRHVRTWSTSREERPSE